MLLHLHIALLASSATSPILLSNSFLSLPVYPISLNSTVSDRAGKPLQPTSTAQILTLQPFCLASSAKGAYFAFLISLDTSILFSFGTVSSIMPCCFVLFVLMYVSVFATAYIVCASKLKFELGSLYMIISKCIFLFFEILFYFGVVPLFSFFTIFYISRVWNSRSWQPIYQIKALI